MDADCRNVKLNAITGGQALIRFVTRRKIHLLPELLVYRLARGLRNLRCAGAANVRLRPIAEIGFTAAMRALMPFHANSVGL